MACCTNLSVTVGTPRFLTPPSGFGISTLRTGWGLYFLVLNCSLMICHTYSWRVGFIPSTPSAPLFRTTCRYALLRFSLDNICSIRLLVSMRSFLSVSLDLTTFYPIGYGRCCHFCDTRHTQTDWLFAPSLHFHYRNFITTTVQSAPIDYFGTLYLVVLPLDILP